MILPVKHKDGGYDIVLARGALGNLKEHLQLDRKVLIVTDDNVPKRYAETVAKACESPYIVTLPHGEATKSFDYYRQLLGHMLENNFTRNDCVIAVGGGVMGDLAGFAAATYMRSIDFYNIPTTLLSQVDSSIGGKVAIDFGGIKNSVGAFYQPKAVIIDPDVLFTLSDRQFSAGLAESIKMAATCNAGLFEFIEKSKNIKDDIDTVIEGSLKIKRDVVEQDPNEKDLRKVLNFGHTVGHAIESHAKGGLLHGECVALGMLPMCSDEVRCRILNLIKKYNLPSDYNCPTDELIPYIIHDKKASSGMINTVFVERIGSFEFRKMTANEIKERIVANNR